MKSNLSVLLLALVAILFLACSEEENKDAATETGTTIGQISATCSIAPCDSATSGFPIILGWSSTTCPPASTPDVSVVQQKTAVCSGGSCTALSDDTWYDDETNAESTTKPVGHTTALAWFDIASPGTSDGPETGDVFCCLEGQSTLANLEDASCQAL